MNDGGPTVSGPSRTSSPYAGLGPRLEASLRRADVGEVRFDRLSRALYSSDASIYQIRPLGVVLPRDVGGLSRALELAGNLSVPLTMRGAGTSQAGQAIGAGLILDTSKYLTGILDFDPQARTVTVEPGLVLDRLNEFLLPHGLFFPVDVATSSRATLGGMAANNSAGGRSIRYGMMADNVRALRVLTADGRESWVDARSPRWPSEGRVEPVAWDAAHSDLDDLRAVVERVRAREAGELAARVPPVLRHVAGYALHRVQPGAPNLGALLVGSEGTLGVFTGLQLALSPIPSHQVLAVCPFATLVGALDAVQHIVPLDPSAVELTDGTLIGLARANPEFRSAVDECVVGDPGALLFVEFAGEDPEELRRALGALDETLAGRSAAPAVRALDPSFQRRIWEVRRAGLNIVMSERSRRKPVSVIEDCAIPLDQLAEWGRRLEAVFERHGAASTWYAHASVGCLHVRPSLDLGLAGDRERFRAIAMEALDLVRELGGSHSGEHGDGIVRSEFIRPMLGDRIADAFAEIKTAFDPEGRLNPGKIVGAPRMDDPALLRATAGRGRGPLDPPFALDWSAWAGLEGAAGMCNNNGACRKMSGGGMCPSYRVTQDEREAPRGRANALRLAITGQMGELDLSSPELAEAMDLCVGCKACKRECPTGVDVAKLKIEVLNARNQRYGVPWRTRVSATLPRWAPTLARLARVVNLRNGSAALRYAGESLGIARERSLPVWAARPFAEPPPCLETLDPALDVVLFVDTFSRYFEPEPVADAVAVLEAAGRRVRFVRPMAGRPLCCGRTWLSAGLVADARLEIERTVKALGPYLERDIPIVGLEPSCLLTFRDEAPAVLGDPALAARLRASARLLTEFLVEEHALGRGLPPLSPVPGQRIHVHGHCHQKALGGSAAQLQALSWVPGHEVVPIESGCCGMAGSFGYEVEHHAVSVAMGELALAPAIRAAGQEDAIVADGTSCRHQIADLTGRAAMHSATLLRRALPGRTSNAPAPD